MPETARPGARPRARDLGIVIGSLPPGPRNAITDVPGVRVGHATLIRGDGPLHVGTGPVRTGVTLVLPSSNPWITPVFAGAHRLNGNGEMTGLEWIRESGLLASPIGITNTHSVGLVRDALVATERRVAAAEGATPPPWLLPVVAETWDGLLNDIDGFHVHPTDVDAAWAAAVGDSGAGAVAEGNVGGGTGMICHGFKGGIGSASRVVELAGEPFTLGVLVQANHGHRSRLAINGVLVGRRIGPDVVPVPRVPAVEQGSGSIIVIVATDAPLLPHQCTRLAQRPALGIGRVGGAGEPSSGDLILAFATGNPGIEGLGGGAASGASAGSGGASYPVRALRDEHLRELFWAAIEATEEAIVNALVAAETMTGRDGITAHALPHDLLREAMGGTRPET